MISGQFRNCDNLSDLLVCIIDFKAKHYHLGFGKSIPRSKGVLCDKRIILKRFESNQLYEKVIRLVKFYDSGQNRTFFHHKQLDFTCN